MLKKKEEKKRNTIKCKPQLLYNWLHRTMLFSSFVSFILHLAATERIDAAISVDTLIRWGCCDFCKLEVFLLLCVCGVCVCACAAAFSQLLLLLFCCRFVALSADVSNRQWLSCYTKFCCEEVTVGAFCNGQACVFGKTEEERIIGSSAAFAFELISVRLGVFG